MATVLESLVIKLAADAADYEKTLKGARSSLDSFAKGAKSIGGKLSLGLTAPLTAMGVASVAAASDMSETVSKVSTIFGDASDEILAWSETTATAMGLSKQAALDAVGTMGNMFSQLGASSGVAGDVSQEMVQLAADLASFHNVAGGAPEVLDAMQSAFRGEYDALQRYIPTINAAAVQQQALAMTGKESAKELTDLEKAMAAQTLIAEGAGAAVGDFARTSDGLANSTRIMQSELANVTASMGEQLLPIALEVVKGLGSLVKWFSDLSPETKRWIVIIGGALAVVGPVIGIIGTLASGISAVIGVVGAASGVVGGLGAVLGVLTGPIGLVVAAVAGLAFAWKKDFLGIRTKTLEVIDSIKEKWPGFVDGLREKWASFTSWVGTTARSAWDGIKDIWRRGGEETQEISRRNWESLKTVWQTGVDGVRGIATAGQQFIKGDWEGGMETLRTTAESGWTNIKRVFSNQLDNVKGIFDIFGWGEIGENIINGIKGGITKAAVWLLDTVENIAERVLNTLKWVLGIESPSKEAAKQVGMPVAEGIGVGLSKGMRGVGMQLQSAMDSLLGDITLAPTLQPATAGGGGPLTLNVYVSGNGTYETGRQVGRGVLDELRAAGVR